MKIGNELIILKLILDLIFLQISTKFDFLISHDIQRGTEGYFTAVRSFL